jgi:hypothetical protein
MLIRRSLAESVNVRVEFRIGGELGVILDRDEIGVLRSRAAGPGCARFSNCLGN